MRMQQKAIGIDWSYKTHFYKEEQYTIVLSQLYKTQLCLTKV